MIVQHLVATHPWSEPKIQGYVFINSHFTFFHLMAYRDLFRREKLDSYIRLNYLQ